MIGAARPDRPKTGRQLCAVAFLLVAALGLALPFAWLRFVSALGPLDLEGAGRGSIIAVDREGKLLRAFTTPEGRWRLPIAASEVDPRFLAMLEAYEDRRFKSHRGVDWPALARAAAQMAWHGRVVSGGSTLSMQVARLIEPREARTPLNKLRQIARAWQIERAVGKAGVLDLYLALAPYGGNIEGVRAASLAYFGKEPRRLSNGEMALLTALPQAPETRRPDRFPDAARAARARVLARAQRAGLITAADARAARGEAIPQARWAFPNHAAHAAEAALRATPETPILRLTLDLKLQAALETLAHEAAQRLGPKISAALLAIDNASGEIRAHVGSADPLSEARAGALDMTQALRSPGSALKPFIYAMAFENGIAHPETILDDRPSRYGLYAPQNFDLSFQGAVTARAALQNSLNLPAIELLSEVGPNHFLARLRNAGARIALPADAAPGLALGLGGLGIKLQDLARLYCGLARGGVLPDLIERQGVAQGANPRAITEPVAAWYVTDILRGAPPPANAAAGRLAFKTGTSYGYRDAFAIGYDRRTTIAVWVGRADNGAVPGLIGRQVAAPLLFDAFARLGREPEYSAPPKSALIARSSQLPPPLRNLRKDVARTFAAGNVASLKIAYPPDGARVDLGLAQNAAAELALKAQGGALPLTWMVNGAPLGAPEARRQSAWTPDGAGFARISVMDARGMTDSVTVRLE